ncbi:MAG TPA: hypothetical protein DCW68_03945 [Rhodospirillaceae bacterium]|nr:MAG: hypothetical protein A2018_07130 [Alphaproteobacteria bacterium GWF2_58_20]HAU29247.1 hypothetical protein [Rhodospirillaceae bacterium]
MILTCPACGAKFNLDDALMPAAGRKVRCGKCAHVWLAMPVSPVEAVPEAVVVERPIPGTLRPEPAPETTERKVVKARLQEDRQPVHFGQALMTLLTFIAAIVAILYFLREQVIMVFPPAETLYERVGVPVGPVWKGLSIINVSANAVPDARGASVTISGEVVNHSGRSVQRPRLLGTLSGGEAPVAFSIPMQPGMIAPGAHEVFSRTLAGVPEKANKVDMRFAP